MKNCDRGLENAAQGRRLRAAFSSPRSQFFIIRADPKPANNFFLFSPGIKLGYQCRVCLRNFVIELAYAPAVYKPLTKNLRNEQVSINSDTRKRKMYFKKNRFISNYFMLLAFSSPVKLSKRVVSV